MAFELKAQNLDKTDTSEDKPLNDHLIGSKYIKNLAPTKEKGLY